MSAPRKPCSVRFIGFDYREKRFELRAVTVEMNAARFEARQPAFEVGAQACAYGAPSCMYCGASVQVGEFRFNFVAPAFAGDVGACKDGTLSFTEHDSRFKLVD
jgi:hypothetical protein